jgi:hypothetical protein
MSDAKKCTLAAQKYIYSVLKLNPRAEQGGQETKERCIDIVDIHCQCMTSRLSIMKSMCYDRKLMTGEMLG